MSKAPTETAVYHKQYRRLIGAGLTPGARLEMGARFTEFRRQRGPPHLLQDDLALALKQLLHHLGPQ